MKTARIKVASLLVIGFGLNCLLLAAVIALGLSEQAKLNASTATMADDRWPKIELATDVRLRVTDIAVSLRNLLLSADPAVRRQQTGSIDDYRREAEAKLAELDRRVVTSSGRATLDKVRAAYQDYVVQQNADHAARANTLAQQASAAMQDIVDSVSHVEEIMAQIKHASVEQHAGIVACSQAVLDMDRGTQQNAALVKQVAAAAQALQEQSAQLESAVAIFKVAPDRDTAVAIGRALAGPVRS